MQETQKRGKGNLLFIEKAPVQYPPFSSYSVEQGKREQLEWIKRQLEYASFSERFQLRYDLKRGEIYEFDWGINVNSEFSNRHFGVVLSDSNEFNPLVIVCPLKTNHTGAHPESDIDLGYISDLSDEKKTIAVVNQIRCLDKLRIYTRGIIKRTSSGTNLAEENDVNMTIPRLNKDKVNMIVRAYFKMLSGF